MTNMSDTDGSLTMYTVEGIENERGVGGGGKGNGDV